MNNKIFGELTFNTGWKTTTDISLYGTNYTVVVKAKAYYEKDGVTSEQESAYAEFKENKQARLVIVENLLKTFAGDQFSERFVPRTLLFQRNGDYAILFDDKQDIDGGIAVTLEPTTEVKYQDEYL